MERNRLIIEGMKESPWIAYGIRLVQHSWKYEEYNLREPLNPLVATKPEKLNIGL